MDAGRLKDLPLFHDMSDDELAAIAPFVDETSVSAGSRLVNEGDYSYQFMAIEEGSAEVLRGGEHLADLGPGDFFGEIALLDDARRRTSTVAATSPMRLAVLQGHDFRVVAREMPAVARQVRAAIDARLAADRRR